MSVSAGTGWVSKLTAEQLAAMEASPKAKSEQAEKVLQAVVPPLNESMKSINGQNVFDLGNFNVEIADEVAVDLTSPRSNSPGTSLRRISQIDNGERDKNLVAEINTAVKAGKSPLVIFGGSHIIQIKPALDYLYGPK